VSRDIFIGDLQGCRAPFEQLLDRLKFDPAADRLLLAGDLVNRGGASLDTLRLVHALRESTVTVLGNHDLHLLAFAHGRQAKANAEFEAILDAPDGPDMIEWLLQQPLLWLDQERRLALVHAGVDPRWGPRMALGCAREIERALADDPGVFFEHMYGNQPDGWHPELSGHDRLRTITNVLTRMRFCTADGRLDLVAKGGPERAPAGFAPWYENLNPGWSGWTLIFGHWSQLGRFDNGRVVCLDSGCVWGGALTALVVERESRRFEAVDCAALS